MSYTCFPDDGPHPLRHDLGLGFDELPGSMPIDYIDPYPELYSLLPVANGAFDSLCHQDPFITQACSWDLGNNIFTSRHDENESSSQHTSLPLGIDTTIIYETSPFLFSDFEYGSATPTQASSSSSPIDNVPWSVPSPVADGIPTQDDSLDAIVALLTGDAATVSSFDVLSGVKASYSNLDECSALPPADLRGERMEHLGVPATLAEPEHAGLQTARPPSECGAEEHPPSSTSLSSTRCKNTKARLVKKRKRLQSTEKTLSCPHADCDSGKLCATQLVNT